MDDNRLRWTFKGFFLPIFATAIILCIYGIRSERKARQADALLYFEKTKEYEKIIAAASDSILALVDSIEKNNRQIELIKKRKNEKIINIRNTINTNDDINRFLSDRYGPK